MAQIQRKSIILADKTTEYTKNYYIYVEKSKSYFLNMIN